MYLINKRINTFHLVFHLGLSPSFFISWFYDSFDGHLKGIVFEEISAKESEDFVNNHIIRSRLNEVLKYNYLGGSEGESSDL
jgi:hypothetical protein